AVTASEFESALHDLLPHSLRRRLETEAPTHFDAPSGSRVPIDYEAEEGPKLAIRVQELFGLSRHPTIAGGRVPLVIELLSPAHPGDGRLASVLAGQLCGSQVGNARALPAPSLAGRPHFSAGNTPRQAPGIFSLSPQRVGESQIGRTILRY